MVIRTLIFLLMLSSCKFNKSDKRVNKSTIIAEIENLKTEEEKQSFLENIYERDQDIRNELTNVLSSFSQKSEEYDQFLLKMIEIDNSNLEKIKQYLIAHGHPSMKLHSEKACATPCLVIHHAIKMKPREELFSYLYKGYIQGDIKPGAFSLYLNRFHEKKFGNRYKMSNPYREEDLIQNLIEKLGLMIITN
ncbi:hypothetical protein GCM10022393_05360 [Aquimarina addita]|uniref:Uncharacterized protein n=1 Tax=Aquimarina addita TaxID=870485 RepID=A0ABP7XA36_9FLAO